jgi:hypothetical protein
MILDFTVKEHETLNDRFRVWARAHEQVCKIGFSSIGGRYSFRILPTGIGTFVTARCACGVETELSESEKF